MMQTIKLEVDPTLATQLAWSPDLNCFLSISSVQTLDLQNQLVENQSRLAATQAMIQSLSGTLALQPIVVQASPPLKT